MLVDWEGSVQAEVQQTLLVKVLTVINIVRDK